MKLKNVIIPVMIFFCLASLISASTQPTQQYSKIFINPFYTANMVKDTNYDFGLMINAPDKVSQVLSSIVTFQIYTTSTPQEYSLLVNGQSCNNPTYSATEKGLAMVMFDCSNTINNVGVYDLTLTSSKDSGSVVGWIDFTYINNPLGDVEFWGTEYRAGERGRVFLQLRDSQGLPENNGNCNLDIYYPYRVNATADNFLTNAPMLHLEGSDGIYFYDIATLPDETGLYMMTAGCNYQLSSAFVYYTDGSDGYYSNRSAETGTYYGSSIALNSYTDYNYQKCSATGGALKYCRATYDFDTTIHFNDTENLTDLNLYYMGEASDDALLTFEVWNWTDGSWYYLPNNLTFSGQSSSAPIGLNDFVSNSIPVSAINDTTGIIRVRLTGASTLVYQEYDNWLNINLKTASGVVQDLKGSSEIHINDWFDYYRQSYTDSVWENFTGDINPNVLGQFANYTWNYSEEINDNILTQITDKIWNYTGSVSSTLLGYFTTAIWTFTDRNLTYYEDVTNYSQVAEYVWYFGDRNLTYYEVNNITPADVWQYTSRNLTFTEDVTNYSKTAEYVWLYVERNLTTEYINNISADEIWTYYNRSLTQDIPLQIWSYPERNLTTDIPFEVWSYYNRTLTYYTINLTELIEMINDYEFSEIIIPYSAPVDTFQSGELNVTLYIIK